MVFLNNNFEKSIYFNLTNIKGLGAFEAKLICSKFGFQLQSVWTVPSFGSRP